MLITYLQLSIRKCAFCANKTAICKDFSVFKWHEDVNIIDVVHIRFCLWLSWVCSLFWRGNLPSCPGDMWDIWMYLHSYETYLIWYIHAHCSLHICSYIFGISKSKCMFPYSACQKSSLTWPSESHLKKVCII